MQEEDQFKMMVNLAKRGTFGPQFRHAYDDQLKTIVKFIPPTQFDKATVHDRLKRFIYRSVFLDGSRDPERVLNTKLPKGFHRVMFTLDDPFAKTLIKILLLDDTIRFYPIDPPSTFEFATLDAESNMKTIWNRKIDIGLELLFGSDRFKWQLEEMPIAIGSDGVKEVRISIYVPTIDDSFIRRAESLLYHVMIYYLLPEEDRDSVRIQFSLRDSQIEIYFPLRRHDILARFQRFGFLGR